MALDPITAGLELGGELIKRWFPDKTEQAKRQAELMTMFMSGELAQFSERVKVIVAEANSEHALTAQWRPLTMLTFVAIVANNYLVYPYLSLFWEAAPLLPLPEDLWDLIKIGLGGYVVGRSVEKAALNWRQDND